MRFKVGDLALVDAKSCSSYEYFNRSYKHGEIVKIVEVCERDSIIYDYLCESESGLQQGMRDISLKPYTPQTNYIKTSGSMVLFNETKKEKVARLKKELEQAEKELSKPPAVNGYEMEILEPEIGCNTIGFGCAKIHSYFFKFINHLNSNMESESPLIYNRSIKSITLNSGVEISIEQCKEIEEFFNKNK